MTFLPNGALYGACWIFKTCMFINIQNISHTIGIFFFLLNLGREVKECVQENRLGAQSLKLLNSRIQGYYQKLTLLNKGWNFLSMEAKGNTVAAIILHN